MTDSPSTLILLFLAALGAGVVNAVAGGGTLLTFPTLFSVLPGADGGVLANATSTVALVPGSLAGAWRYRRELGVSRRWLLLLSGPSLAGGLIGALLLIMLPGEVFSRLVPWLILAASFLFLVQPVVSRLVRQSKGAPPSRLGQYAVAFFQFLVGIYGGYFGAGIGILMLSALAMMGIPDIHRMNALKTLLAALINMAAVVVFVIHGQVVWPYALLMAAAAIVGGYLGAHFALRLHPGLVRGIVIVIGFGLAAHYFYKQWAGGPS